MKRILAILIVSPIVICSSLLWVCIGLVALAIQTLATIMSWQMRVAHGNNCTFCEMWNLFYAGSALEHSIKEVLDIFGG